MCVVIAVPRNLFTVFGGVKVRCYTVQMKAVCNLNVALKDYMYAVELNVPPLAIGLGRRLVMCRACLRPLSAAA